MLPVVLSRCAIQRGFLVILCCIGFVLPVLGGQRSGFLRIADPSAPVQSLAPFIEEQCNREEVQKTKLGPLTLRYPESCEHAVSMLGPVLSSGFEILAQMTRGLQITIDTEVVVLDDRRVPRNISHRAAGNTLILLAPEGCDQPSWWRTEAVWRAAIEHLFHETTHAVFAPYLPKKTPRWIDEGSASYVEERIANALAAKAQVHRENSGHLEARFVAARPAQIRELFVREKARRESTDQTLAAYELFAGAFFASERLNESLFDRLLEVAASGARKRDKLAALRALDPLELVSRAQANRQELVREAMESGGDGAARALGWLAVCEDAPSVPENVCSMRTVTLAPYLGNCLDQEDLAGLIEAVGECGNLIPHGWGVMIERACVRFPESTRRRSDWASMLSPDSLDSLEACVQLWKN